MTASVLYRDAMGDEDASGSIGDTDQVSFMDSFIDMRQLACVRDDDVSTVSSDGRCSVIVTNTYSHRALLEALHKTRQTNTCVVAPRTTRRAFAVDSVVALTEKR